ncbi:MAG: hypothetical protein ACTSRP_26675 [Candidatus Helarchaeota archaeon]
MKVENTNLESRKKTGKNKDLSAFVTKRRFIRLAYFLISFLGFNIIQVYLSYNLIIFIIMYIFLLGISIYMGINITRIKFFNFKKLKNIRREYNISISEFEEICKICKDQHKEKIEIPIFILIIITGSFLLLFMVLACFELGVNIVFNIGWISFFSFIIFIVGISIGVISGYSILSKKISFSKDTNFLINFYKNYLYKESDLRFLIKIRVYGDYFVFSIDKIIILRPKLEKVGFKCLLVQISVSDILYPYCVLVLDKKEIPNVDEYLPKNKPKKKKSLLRRLFSSYPRFKWPIIFETPYSPNESVVVVRYDIPSNTTEVPVISISQLNLLYKKALNLMNNIFEHVEDAK